MASYATDITIERPVEAAFAFVSNFANAAAWDPRTYAAEKVTDGPIGLGTRFVLTGGALKESTLRRLRLPPRRLPFSSNSRITLNRSPPWPWPRRTVPNSCPGPETAR